MKKLFTLFALFVMAIVSMAQTQNIYEWKDGTVYVRNSSDIDSLTFALPADQVILSLEGTNISTNSITVTFTLQTDLSISGAEEISEQGICYSTTAEAPTYEDDKAKFGPLTKGSCSVTIANLTPSTAYYMRPYLKIGNEIFYESEYTKVVTASAEEWVSLGTGKFSDAFLGSAEQYSNVKIEQKTSAPNTFRLANPYAEILPGIETGKYFEFSVLPKGYDFNGTVLDSEYVVFNDYNMGKWNSNYDEDIYAIHPYRFGRTPDKWTYNAVLDYQENGLPGEVSLAPIYYLFEAKGGWDKSTTNTISILFPGYAKRDYSASVEFLDVATDATGTSYAKGYLTLGADAKNVKAIVMPADADAMAVADAIASGEIQAMNATAGENNIPFDAKALGGNKFQIIVAVLNNNSVKNVATASFEYYGENGNPWKSLGIGYFTDDIVAPMFGIEAVTYEVEIMESTETPGLYRVMNPYSNSVYPYAENDCAPEGLYLEINATDAEGVYIEQQSLGFDWGYGEFGFETVGASLLGSYDFDTIKGAGYFGKVIDSAIMFPTFTAKNEQQTKYQGYLYMGESGYYAGMNSKIEIVLPSANTFARNMAIAKANTTKRNFSKNSFSGKLMDVKHMKAISHTIETTVEHLF